MENFSSNNSNELPEEVPLEPLLEGFKTYRENGKRALRKLVLKNTLAHDHQVNEREGRKLEKITNAYEAIPIPDSIKEPLCEIARSFIEQGRTELENLLTEFEDLLGDDLFDAVAEHLPEIIAIEEERAQASSRDDPVSTG